MCRHCFPPVDYGANEFLGQHIKGAFDTPVDRYNLERYFDVSPLTLSRSSLLKLLSHWQGPVSEAASIAVCDYAGRGAIATSVRRRAEVTTTHL